MIRCNLFSSLSSVEHILQNVNLTVGKGGESREKTAFNDSYGLYGSNVSINAISQLGYKRPPLFRS